MENAPVILEAAPVRTPGFRCGDRAPNVGELRLAGVTGAIAVEGRRDPFSREDLEMTSPVRALNDVKDCRGGPRFIAAPA
jgi:hypothetical protein